MIDRDWDKDFDRNAWQTLGARTRKEWIETAWTAERDDEGLYEIYTARQKRYERGQTAWDIGLGPMPFDLTLSEAVGEVKPEHWDGVVFGSRDVRHRVLSALLANAGLRRTVLLAPRQRWEAVLAERASGVAWERAVAADRASGTRTARYERAPTPTPVIRPEFVMSVQPDIDVPFYWVRHQVAHPFHIWDLDQHAGDVTKVRTVELGYVTIGDHTLSRVDLLVLRRPWRNRDWPTASDPALVVYVANGQGPLLFDWQVRRPAHFQAGTEEVWVVDTENRRVLRQLRGEKAHEVRYSSPGQTITWRDGSDEVIVELKELFEHVPESARVDETAKFEDFSAQQFRRLQRFETPWTVGYTPQWFISPIAEFVGRFKDELWDGTLFGPEYLRDTLLSALLANVGLCEVLQLAPLELWRQALP